MKKPELRVGNVVGMMLQALPENFFTVSEVGSTMKIWQFKDAQYVDVDDLEPVKLNGDILERFGFNGSPDWNIKKYDGLTHVLDLGYFIIGKNMMGNSVTLYTSEGISTGIHCDYAHELQNLYYALKKEDLIFK